MKRKDFLQTFLPAGLGALYLGKAPAQGLPDIHQSNKLIPPYLKPGDTIAITCPAGPLELADAANCIDAIQSWGYKVKMGNTVDDQWQVFSGTDEQRLAELQECLDDETISAIIFGRGGYGVMRIMDRINWERFVKKPKWLVGYSDITALHCHVNSNYQIPTIHADMANGFNGIADEAETSIKELLAGKLINYSFAGSLQNLPGMVKGELAGGNLSLICAMQASKSQLKTEGKILVIEDVSEYKYTIDRMLLNLKRSGMLDKLAALAVGSFTNIKIDNDENFAMSLEEILLDKVNEFGYPVCFNFPAGHQKMNLALKLGLNYQLIVNRSFCSLTELPIG